MSDAIANFSTQDLTAMPSVARGEARVHPVPLVLATSDTLRGYATVVRDFASERVRIVPWPVSGWRPLVPGTGDEGGIVQDRFEMARAGSHLYATNHAVGRRYLIGWFGDPATASADREPEHTRAILTHEANYHPDGGQVFFPRAKQPFVALLARPGDDVRPEHFVAFYCDGSFGLQVLPDVWHQPLYPCGDRLEFDDKQGAVHACVSFDVVAEFGAYLSVPLRA